MSNIMSNNKDRSRRKRKLELGVLMLLVVFVIMAGATGAWYQSKSVVTNSFNAGRLKTTIAENFTPPEKWFPGVTTDKVVQIINTGTLAAYTRVELQPTLVFYTKTGDTVSIAELNTADTDETDTSKGDADKTDADKADTDTSNTAEAVTAVEQHYATINKSAVESVAKLGGYKKITNADLTGDYASLKDKLTISDGVTLYAKVINKEVSEDESGGTTTTYSYGFVGYYEADGKCYEISVTEGSNNKYDILLYLTQKNKYDYTTKKGKEVIDKAITLYFCGDDGKNSTELSSKWVKTTVSTADDGEIIYFYYKDVLQSGATTAPLLNAVKLNDDFIYDIYEASFDLNVVNLSSQAYNEAAQAVFGASDTSFNADKVYGSAANSGESSNKNENSQESDNSGKTENGEKSGQDEKDTDEIDVDEKDTDEKTTDEKTVDEVKQDSENN